MDGLIGRKIGMTSVFDADGKMVPCTVVEVTPNTVTQVKSEEVEGYNALQLSFGKRKDKRMTQALKGHLSSSKISSTQKIKEMRNTSIDKAVGESITVDELFAEGDTVNAIGICKGKGFQGVVKRHGFGGVGQATHGQHNRQRAPGAIGACSTPSKVYKGTKMAGRMGGNRVKIRNLKVVRIFPEKDLILVKGAVPGRKGSLVIIEK